MSAQKPKMADLPIPEHIDVKHLAESYLAGDIDLVCVLGPTASGKTKYAVALAHNIFELTGNQCEIISADSRQIYTGMDIGTGKDLADYADIPYHLIDIVSAGSQYNVYRYVQDFKKAYGDIVSRGAIPILCGGTGMYINAVTAGYDFRTSKPLSENGKAFSSIQEGLPRKTYFIGTLVSRETRNNRIDSRLDARLKEGMIEEIQGLLDSGIAAETLISYGLEYKYVTLHLTGQMGYDEMVEKLAIAIHQFAKRQMTWFRGMERSGTVIHWTEV